MRNLTTIPYLSDDHYLVELIRRVLFSFLHSQSYRHPHRQKIPYCCLQVWAIVGGYTVSQNVPQCYHEKLLKCPGVWHKGQRLHTRFHHPTDKSLWCNSNAIFYCVSLSPCNFKPLTRECSSMIAEQPQSTACQGSYSPTPRKCGYRDFGFLWWRAFQASNQPWYGTLNTIQNRANHVSLQHVLDSS